MERCRLGVNRHFFCRYFDLIEMQFLILRGIDAQALLCAASFELTMTKRGVLTMLHWQNDTLVLDHHLPFNERVHAQLFGVNSTALIIIIDQRSVIH